MKAKTHCLCGCGLLLLVLSGCYKISFEEISGSYPVKNMQLTRVDGRPDELLVRVQQGVRLASLVDTSFFDGLDYRMSLQSAKRQLGEPVKERVQRDMRLTVSLYPVPKGEVGFMGVPSSGGTQNQVWAFPTNQSLAAVILNESLRAQILRLLPGDRAVRVQLLRDVGFGGITLGMSSNRIEYLILGLRDGE